MLDRKPLLLHLVPENTGPARCRDENNSIGNIVRELDDQEDRFYGHVDNLPANEVVGTNYEANERGVGEVPDGEEQYVEGRGEST